MSSQSVLLTRILLRSGVACNSVRSRGCHGSCAGTVQESPELAQPGPPEVLLIDRSPIDIADPLAALLRATVRRSSRREIPARLLPPISTSISSATGNTCVASPLPHRALPGRIWKRQARRQGALSDNARVVKKALHGDRTVQQIGAKRGVHPNRVSQ